ncbi:MAG: hypothetical protein IBX72_10620 [Nitrospirae bacterium]|jgi:hypothetical protein|nr:hypothetical protein [Nitrospirota bacterium]
MIESSESIKDAPDQFFISTKRDKIKKLILILMESPFYMTLSPGERYLLLKKLLELYPFLFENQN